RGIAGPIAARLAARGRRISAGPPADVPALAAGLEISPRRQGVAFLSVAARVAEDDSRRARRRHFEWRAIRSRQLHDDAVHGDWKVAAAARHARPNRLAHRQP